MKEWRERNGVTQQQLAELLVVYNVTISRWETGFSPIPNYRDLALAELERRLSKKTMGSKTSKNRREVKTKWE